MRLPGRRPEVRARQVAARVTLLRPFLPSAYEKVLTDIVGTPTRLVALPAALPGTGSTLTGMMIRLNNIPYLFYRADTGLAHQLHVIHHELYHLLEQHSGVRMSDPIVKDTVVHLLRDELPNLSSGLIRRLVGRSCQAGGGRPRLEHEAERFALAMASRLDLSSYVDETSESEAGRVHRLLSDGML
jgi:hypothetical protein